MSPQIEGIDPLSKDLEGIPDSFEAAPETNDDEWAKPAPGVRQKKIAVLTSGGDSAGMNAAGK